MVVRNLCIFALLVAFASAAIDCSQEDTCFSEPMDCNPDTSCKTLFRFDEQGNLDLYLRNFTEPMGYAAFAVQKHVDETYEYFICIPHKGQRLRALAELGEAVLVTEHNISGVVEPLGANNFRCHFNSIELPQKFQQGQEFFVSTGIFDEALVIVDGVQLYNMEPEYDDEEEVLDEETLPLTHYIGGFSDHVPSEDVFTEVDGDVLTEAIEDMRAMSKTDEEDVEMEKLARKNLGRRRRSKAQKEDFEEDEATRQKSRSRDDDREESSDEESMPRRRDHKGTRHGRRQDSSSRSDEDEDNVDNYVEEYTRFHDEDTYMSTRRSNGRRQQKPNSRAPSRSNEDEDQEEDEYTPRRRDNSRRHDSRRRNAKPRDTEEEEDSEDEYTPRRRDTKRGRPSRYEEDLEEDEEYLPKKSKTRRHNKHDDEDLEDDDESPRRRSTRKNKKRGNDENDYESEENDDEYEDYDNASKVNIAFTAILIVISRFL